MSHNLTFTPEAFDNYKEWAISDKKIFKKINDLIQSIDRTHYFLQISLSGLTLKEQG